MTKTADNWKDVESVLPHVSRILLYGPPGTGKTTLGFADEGREVYYVPLHEETAVAELIGHFVPVGSRFVWFDGPVLMAWQKGARLILDEIDQSGGAVLSVLRAILNDPGIAQLVLPDPSLAALSDEEMAEFIAAGEGQRIVRPNDGFQVIATMNGEPEDLDEPLLDRFEATFRIPAPHPAAIKALPDDLQAAAQSTSKHDDPARRIGLRRWKAFAALREHVGEDTASRAVFGARHGDVMDALRLARPAKSTTTASDVMDALKPEDPAAAEPAPIEVTPDTPVVYFKKTGKRGRPPLVVCPTHGYKMTHRTAEVAEDGALHCKRCDSVTAAPGEYTRRALIGGEWTTV